MVRSRFSKSSNSDSMGDLWSDLGVCLSERLSICGREAYLLGEIPGKSNEEWAHLSLDQRLDLPSSFWKRDRGQKGLHEG